MTKRFVFASLMAGLMLGLALPAAAQEVLDDPYEQIQPIVVEREEPGTPGDPAAPGVADSDGTEVREVALARTGAGLSVGAGLALALILAGAGALFLASRRTGADKA